MQRVIRNLAGWRIQLELLFRKRVLPSLAMGVVAGLLTAALVWAFQSDRSPEMAAAVMGLASFGGMFLLITLGAGMLFARDPEQMIAEIRHMLARKPESRWRMAQLAKAEVLLVPPRRRR
jgi:hypothetical protein